VRVFLQGLEVFEKRRSAIREGTDRNQESIKVMTFGQCNTYYILQTPPPKEGGRVFTFVVCLSVCLCVCVLDYVLDYAKSYERIWMKFLEGWCVVQGTVD